MKVIIALVLIAAVFADVDDDNCYCNDGTFWNNATPACEDLTVANCRRGTAAAVCTVCENGHFLANATTCTASSSVSNCDYYTSADVCATCADGYVLKSDGSMCVQGVSNCYTQSVGSDDTVTCTVCMNNYTLADNACGTLAAPSVDGCAAWSDASGTNVCVACDDGKILDGQECKTITAEGCLNDLLTDFETCLTCQPNLVRDSNNKSCIAPTSPVDNCIYYDETDAAGVCLGCDGTANKYLENATTCSDVTTQVANCGVYSDATTCSSCAGDYAGSTSGTCPYECPQVTTGGGSNSSILSASLAIVLLVASMLMF